MRTLLILMLAAFAGTGHAQPGGALRGPGPGQGERLKELLNLSDETAGKIEKLSVEHRKLRIALRAKLDAARVDFRSLMREDDPDEKLAMAKQKEMSGIREELRSSELAHRFAVSKLLTPEQRKIMKEHRRGMAGVGRVDGTRGERGRRFDERRQMKHPRGMRGRRMMERDGD